jgi:two-component system, OmpR family, sensor histidine kinase KdpD
MTAETKAQPPVHPVLSRMLLPRRIVIWNQPVQRDVVLRALVETAWKEIGTGDLEALFGDVMKREEQGSTFFNEGVAFPHVRVKGLTKPVVALGLTRQGVSDQSTEKAIRIVFLILSPAEAPDTQVQVLALASRAAQNRYFLQSLQSCQTPEEVLTALRNWETLK